MQIAHLDRRHFLSATVITGTAICLGVSDAAAASWAFLGSRRVRLSLDVDVIPVTAGAGMFEAVQLRVRDNGIFMKDMRITFGNGSKMDVPLRRHIPRGGRTRAVDLPGRKRNIRSVRLTYRSELDLGGHATVELWGRR